MVYVMLCSLWLPSVLLVCCALGRPITWALAARAPLERSAPLRLLHCALRDIPVPPPPPASSQDTVPQR